MDRRAKRIKWPKIPRSRGQSRASPYRHPVRAHKREGYQVHSYIRGQGDPKPHKMFSRQKLASQGRSTWSHVSALHSRRTPVGRRTDQSLRAPITENYKLWVNAPNQYDVVGVDTIGGFNDPDEIDASDYTHAKISMNQMGGIYRVDVWAKDGKVLDDKYGFKKREEAQKFIDKVNAQKPILHEVSTYLYHTQGMGASMYAKHSAIDWRDKNAPDAIILPYTRKDNKWEIAGFIVVNEKDAKNIELEGKNVTKPSELTDEAFADYQGFIYSWSAKPKKEGYSDRNREIIRQYETLTGNKASTKLTFAVGDDTKQSKNVSTQIKGVSASYNKATGWMQIKFDEKPSREILDQLKSEGFRYRPQSRTWAAKENSVREELLEKLAGKIEEVNIEISYSKRAENYQRLADKYQAEAREYRERERKIMDMIPFGQPILVGHHSERRHRRDLERSENYRKKGMDAYEKYEKYQRLADESKGISERGENPITISNRIKKLEADERAYLRQLEDDQRNKTYDEDRRKQLNRTRDRLEIERRKYKESGGTTSDKVEFKPGMRVWTEHGPATIKTVSKKSLRIDYDAKYLGGLRTNRKVDLTDIRDVIPEKSKYDPMIDQYLESNYEAVKVEVKNVDPDTLNRDLHRRIHERGLQDKIDASISDNTVYLEKNE